MGLPEFVGRDGRRSSIGRRHSIGWRRRRHWRGRECQRRLLEALCVWITCIRTGLPLDPLARGAVSVGGRNRAGREGKLRALNDYGRRLIRPYSCCLEWQETYWWNRCGAVY